MSFEYTFLEKEKGRSACIVFSQCAFYRKGGTSMPVLNRVAQAAEIQAAKHNWELILICHPLPPDGHRQFVSSVRPAVHGGDPGGRYLHRCYRGGQRHAGDVRSGNLSRHRHAGREGRIRRPAFRVQKHCGGCSGGKCGDTAPVGADAGLRESGAGGRPLSRHPRPPCDGGAGGDGGSFPLRRGAGDSGCVHHHCPAAAGTRRPGCSTFADGAGTGGRAHRVG